MPEQVAIEETPGPEIERSRAWIAVEGKGREEWRERSEKGWVRMG